MKHSLIVISILILAGSGWNLFAQTPTARIREITGTVEIKAPAGNWVPAQTGMNIEKATMISTGFKSSAVLSLGDSILTVRPLTRLSLEEISASQGDEKVGLYLQTGRIRAEVIPPPGSKTDFTVRSPTATASVRGTIFEFDGINLWVIEGKIFLTSITGSGILVRQGESSMADGTTGSVSNPREDPSSAFLFVPSAETGSSPGPKPDSYGEGSINAKWPAEVPVDIGWK